MSGSHGDLFREIGKLVLAAHAGQAIDLSAKSEELAERYGNLGMPAELVAKMIARSLGAIGVSMAILSNGHGTNGHDANGHAGENVLNGNGHSHSDGDPVHVGRADVDVTEVVTQSVDVQAKAASALFPSGLRIAVLS